ncbi:helix-turn-helix domain-containing protein [Bizionia sediminis]|uniref:Helix-turn-helix domain-containing protein n=1 Tax=Bizionia sediminis TaxID=1737064 RepID=A0ABW5KPJ4_9FLAO
MINSDEFSKRLEQVIKFYDESASSFAEKIGVQRSSISHILSGRNKPSLDFIMKILERFPEVELYWLLYGTGTFPKTVSNEQAVPIKTPAAPSKNPEFDFESTAAGTKPVINKAEENMNENTDIERVIIFYKNGSFKAYKP